MTSAMNYQMRLGLLVRGTDYVSILGEIFYIIKVFLVLILTMISTDLPHSSALIFH